MSELKNIIRCKYAGDPEDEFCSQCDGLHPVDDNGNAVDAPMCGGYEPEERVQEQPVVETPDSRHETAADSPVMCEPSKEPTKGVTTVIRAESGVSREINGTWYKFLFSEERVLPEGCDIEAEKQALWDSVNAEVDAQVEAVRN